jgi:hypothetical protein
MCYAIGGGADSGTDSAAVDSYDRSNDTITAVQSLPEQAVFGNYTGSAYGNYIMAIGGNLTSLNTETYIYNELTDSWQTVTPLFDVSAGYTATAAGQYYYVFTIVSGQANAYRLNLENIAGGYSLVASETGWAGFGLTRSKTIYDPEENKFLIFAKDDGFMITFNPITAAFDFTSSTYVFDPCDTINNCAPSLAFYDANFGIVAGKQGDPSSTTIGLYQWDWEGGDGDGGFSASTVETLSNANFNSLQFTQDTDSQPEAGWVTDDEGITQTFFGSSKSNSSNPGYNANQYWLRTGDPGGVTTTENTFDTWLVNFFASMGMDSPVGRILVGSLFIMAIFMVMAIKGVPWIISLGLTGISAVMLTLVNVLDEAILLSLIAIVMFGGMGLIFALFMGGDRGDG